jgi:hypothetical protein
MGSVEHSPSKGSSFTGNHEMPHIFKAENLLHTTQEPTISSQSEADKFSPKSFCFLNINLKFKISKDA